MKEIPNYWGLVRIAISPFLFSILMAGHPINIDGQFQDWENVEISYEDEAGPWWADFANVKITYDQEFLFIYFSLPSLSLNFRFILKKNHKDRELCVDSLKTIHFIYFVCIFFSYNNIHRIMTRFFMN